jgi:methionyl-tRNA formyltransferase
MNLVFMATPEIALPSVEAILKSKHTIKAIVTAPDKERGRGKKITFTPVKQFALDNGLKVFSPTDLKDPEFVSELRKLQADLFVVFAFRILPKEIYSMPRYGSFNLHGSLLPKYRGAAPIQWSIINGDKETGVTTFFLQDKVDTGEIILQRKLAIEEADDFGSLHDKMSLLASDVIFETLELIEKGNAEVCKQDDSIASPAPKITKELCCIDWNKSAVAIQNLVRGLSPHPAAYFMNKGKVVKLFKSRIVRNVSLESGEISQTKKELCIGCSDDALEILELQLEGKKRMGTEEFLRGHSLL